MSLIQFPVLQEATSNCTCYCHQKRLLCPGIFHIFHSLELLLHFQWNLINEFKKINMEFMTHILSSITPILSQSFPFQKAQNTKIPARRLFFFYFKFNSKRILVNIKQLKISWTFFIHILSMFKEIKLSVLKIHVVRYTLQCPNRCHLFLLNGL